MYIYLVLYVIIMYYSMIVRDGSSIQIFVYTLDVITTEVCSTSPNHRLGPIDIHLE